MITHFRKVTVIQVKKKPTSINEKIQWLSHSLGLVSTRDKEKSCYRLFIELIKASRKGNPLTSDELAYKLNLSRGTVIHHLSKLIAAGLVVQENNKYSLRKKDLKTTIEAMRSDMDETFEDIEKVADNIDSMLGF